MPRFGLLASLACGNPSARPSLGPDHHHRPLPTTTVPGFTSHGRLDDVEVNDYRESPRATPHKRERVVTARWGDTVVGHLVHCRRTWPACKRSQGGPLHSSATHHVNPFVQSLKILRSQVCSCLMLVRPRGQTVVMGTISGPNITPCCCHRRAGREYPS